MTVDILQRPHIFTLPRDRSASAATASPTSVHTVEAEGEKMLSQFQCPALRVADPWTSNSTRRVMQRRGSAMRTAPRAGKNGDMAKQQQRQAASTHSIFDEKEASGTLDSVSQAPATVSLARQAFDPKLEQAINDQINIEYNISYTYHALHAFFDRDNVALPGLAKHFLHASEEEREHAGKLMKLQSIRGGRVVLQSLLAPNMEYDNEEKGDALHAMEVSLSFEKLNFAKLRALHKAAGDADDAQVADFVEAMLQEQVEDIKVVADMVSQLKRVGRGQGTWAWDKQLLEDSK